MKTIYLLRYRTQWEAPDDMSVYGVYASQELMDKDISRLRDTGITYYFDSECYDVITEVPDHPISWGLQRIVKGFD